MPAVAPSASRHPLQEIGEPALEVVKGRIGHRCARKARLEEDPHRLFEADPELNSRKSADINLDPVDLNVPSERRYFFKFVGQVDRQMERDGIVERRIGLIEDLRSRAMTYDISGGVVGNVVRILRIALRLAHRDKRRSIEWRDMEAAFYAWKTSQVDDNGQQVEVYDPFAEGPQAQTLDAVKGLD